MARHQLKQIERQLILYDIFQTNEEDTRISTILYHLPGLKVRTLQRDIRDLTEAGLLQVYFSRDKNAYINYEGAKDWRYYSESIQKRIAQKKLEPAVGRELSGRQLEHLERLRRLTVLMGKEVYENADKMYFELFPGATERMRKRDFEVLRNIGFYAGYDAEERAYVLHRMDGYGIYDSYGVRYKNGKMWC